ncbi:MAG: AI-2E family transporter [Actinomycetes bacterium]
MIPDSDNRRAPSVPPVLATLAAWSWRLIVVGVVVYFFAQIVVTLRFVALPVAIALLLTALLFPLTDGLRRVGLNSMAATWLTMLTAFAVLGITGWIVGVRANEEFPRLVEQIQTTARDVQDWLIHGPLELRESQLADIVAELTRQLNEQRAAITGTLVTGAAVAVEVLAGLVLVLFVTFFLLKDGERIWSWFLKAFGSAKPRVDRAGRAAWRTLSQYVQGTVIVAAVHGVIMGIVLAGMGVPLWAPLAVLIFLASFIPIVGIFFAGGLATLVTLGAKGPIYALVFVGILVVEQQLENHVLQPLIVGRAVKFHPLAIILVLAVGGVLAGITGAAVAVPIAAVLYRALPELFREQAALPPPPGAGPGEGPPEPPRRPPGDETGEDGGERPAAGRPRGTAGETAPPHGDSHEDSAGEPEGAEDVSRPRSR